MSNKLDITSTVIEKSIDGVKGFLGKLIGPAVEETGLLMADNIKLFRFKNQIRILEKAQKIVLEKNIDMKKISMKNLVPLLEYSSLEEDETLQAKWVNLLVNYIDANEKYESSIFPFILSQLSSQEAQGLENFRNEKVLRAGILGVTNFGIANWVRLGLVRQLPPPIKADEKTIFRKKQIIVKYNNDMEHFYHITELGMEFLECCSSK